MSLNENQQKVLDLICSHSGGIDIHDLIERSGLDYPEIEHIARELNYKGFRVCALKIGADNSDPRFKPWIKRLFLSAYDENYETLIN
jgi:hypothetical protein